ncbi:hypothetical protein PAXRUDRAFT_159512 [Paxillus rubicundulus Ve08.2h10]|uniref:Uncharacterized protein n=1 Tax=Paxillus rubicundulus Ve08.2h10 TaxID=930991 RepID=A0A0D0CX42_9AGAM|nr:hypothetical protein PAXRUDRAFT_159512 [Paxillus rubicundulus Ve08.2h10]
MALKQNIMNITTNGAARVQDPVYLCFLETLQDASLRRSFVKFAKGSSTPTQVYLNAQPGYYGSKGTAIFELTLMHIVDLERTPMGALGGVIFTPMTRDTSLITLTTMHGDKCMQVNMQKHCTCNAAAFVPGSI